MVIKVLQKQSTSNFKVDRLLIHYDVDTKTQETKPDQTRHTVKTETAVKLIHNHPVQAVTETRLGLHLCQPGCVFRTHREGHMATAATENQMLLNSTHK